MMEGREGWLWTVADERRRYDANALSARARTMARLPRRNIFSFIVSSSPSQGSKEVSRQRESCLRRIGDWRDGGVNDVTWWYSSGFLFCLEVGDGRMEEG